MVYAIIVPAALRSTLNAIGAQLGDPNDGSTLTIPLRTVGQTDPTHWGCMPCVTRLDAITSIEGLKQTEPFVSQAIVEVLAEPDLRTSWVDLLAAHNLEELPPPPRV